MSGKYPLTEVFAATRGDDSVSWLGDRQVVEPALASLHQAGALAYPSVVLDPNVFVRHIAERVEAGGPEALAKLAASDLYLACACLSGDPSAIQIFDAVMMREVESGLRRLRATASEVEELRQLMRERLLWGNDGSRARLADYGGRGDLRGWLRVTAVRLAMNLLRSQKREQVRHEKLAEIVPSRASDPALHFLRKQYGAEFKLAFETAIEQLSSRERTLLRLSFYDGLGIDEIGRAFSVHRSSAARWLADARQNLLETTRRLLMQRFSAERVDVDSLFKLIDSDLDLSIQRRLQSDPKLGRDPGAS